MTRDAFDKQFLTNDVRLLCGVDEAGRGPLAGAVFAAVQFFLIQDGIQNFISRFDVAVIDFDGIPKCFHFRQLKTMLQITVTGTGTN